MASFNRKHHKVHTCCLNHSSISQNFEAVAFTKRCLFNAQNSRKKKWLTLKNLNKNEARRILF